MQNDYLVKKLKESTSEVSYLMSVLIESGEDPSVKDSMRTRILWLLKKQEFLYKLVSIRGWFNKLLPQSR